MIRSLFRPSIRRRLFAGAALAAVVGGLSACAQSGPGGPPPDGPRAGWMGGHHGPRGPMDPEQMGRMMGRGIDRMLGSVDATPEQRKAATDIARQAMVDLAPLRERHRAARTKAMDLLSAPTVDRNALETLRADELAAAETASRRMTKALADFAEVLTPEQRAKLRERAERRFGRG